MHDQKDNLFSEVLADCRQVFIELSGASVVCFVYCSFFGPWFSCFVA